jgi:hypothetical protein
MQAVSLETQLPATSPPPARPTPTQTPTAASTLYRAPAPTLMGRAAGAAARAMAPAASSRCAHTHGGLPAAPPDGADATHGDHVEAAGGGQTLTM